MSTISIGTSELGTTLQQLLMCDGIQPGTEPSYQICKAIFEFHPIGRKMADSPIAMAQSQAREITVQSGPEERIKKAFLDEWEAIGADRHIANVMRLSRVYGVASIALLTKDTDSEKPVKYEDLWKADIAFNVLDPLNTAGSLVLNQQPNAMDFLKTDGISVAGQAYHRSRSVIKLNEEPIYLGYTTSAFGYVGRSVYQRALFPLKSFVNSMRTDDLITRKAGVLVAKMKAPGSIADRLMATVAGSKRDLVKEAETDNVISITPEEDIASLDLQNLNGAAGYARKNILENIAVAADMPAKMLNSETFAEGFGEGTEDAKDVARYIDGIRIEMQPLYAFFDRIVQYRAWNPEFYATIQNEFPDEFEDVPYNEAFYRWRNSFAAVWPSLLAEPPSEKVKVDDVKLKAIIALLEVLLPALDPENKAAMIQWAADNFNSLALLFSSPLSLDMEALRDYVPPTPAVEPAEPKPFAAQDSAGVASLIRNLRRA